MKQRLIKFLSYLGIGQLAFEDKVGLSRGFVNNIGYSIREKSINKILSVYPELSKTWLLTGEGEMLKSSVGVHATQVVAPSDGQSLQEIQRLRQELSELKDKYIEVLEENRKLRQFPPADGKFDAASREEVERMRKVR